MVRIVRSINDSITLVCFRVCKPIYGKFHYTATTPFYGNHISVLSIDGGGIRGIIPAVVLDYLDKALKAKDPDTPLAHYFDVISGTSTGGMMTAMLAAPYSSHHTTTPLFTPVEVVQFYKKYGTKIFKDRLIDGGVAAYNPAMVAVGEVIQHNEQKEILMLSLGTGTSQAEEKLSGIREVACQLSWLIGHTGLISDVLYSTDMISYHLATVFPSILPANNFLRIQEYNLDPSMEPMDNVDEENMDNLEKVGKMLLQQNVLRMKANITHEIGYTNAQALDSLADILFKERQFRLRNKSMAKEGTPFIETVV
ncbi:hypothetical protein Fmac_028837 [Flemingia macrophylla]|uniref:Patatin n=1 Tax=Flemingia macrophylla TaxID=520843 RepID=A0ABD1L8Y9_9FABA